MMELPIETIRYIGKEIDRGADLGEILSQDFPHASIAIVRGYDNFSNEAYVQSAYFREADARVVMAELEPNGSPGMSDTFHIITHTVEELSRGGAKDLTTGRFLDEVDRDLVYTYLEESLKTLVASRPKL